MEISGKMAHSPAVLFPGEMGYIKRINGSTTTAIMPNAITMNDGVMIKRSPIILIWNFAIIEAGGLLLYAGAMLLGGAKYQLYTDLSFSNVLSYQLAKILFLSAAQFAVSIYAFLSWFYGLYVVTPRLIRFERGVFLKKRGSLPVNNNARISITSNPLGRLFHYGTIHVTADGGAALSLRYISRPDNIAEIIKRTIHHRDHAFENEPDVRQLLLENEHDRLEFKSSLRFDYKIGKASRDVEKSAMKTVAAFLNSQGGHLVLGVNDARVPLGIENDCQTLQRKDADGFENHFTQTFNSMIGPEFRSLVKLWFPKLDDHDLCVVQVLASPRPVYLKTDSDEQFYMRTGNTSTSLKLSAIESYSRTRWPRPVYED